MRCVISLATSTTSSRATDNINGLHTPCLLYISLLCSGLPLLLLLVLLLRQLRQTRSSSSSSSLKVQGKHHAAILAVIAFAERAHTGNTSRMPELEEWSCGMWGMPERVLTSFFFFFLRENDVIEHSFAYSSYFICLGLMT